MSESHFQKTIDHAFKRAFQDMDPLTGLYPDDWSCTRCGKPLQEHERYAGNFNGLCYPCTSKEPYLVKVYVLDDAQMWSWPPHLPSWRRDREIFTGFEGCELFGGRGATRGKDPFGGHYRGHCEPCYDRFWAHPERAANREAREALQEAAQAAYEVALKKALGLPSKVSKKRFDAAAREVSEDIIEAVRSPIAEQYASQLVELARQRELLFVTRDGCR